MRNIKILIIKIQSEIYIWLIKHLYGVKSGTIVFQGKPDYADNPRALSDYLITNGYTVKYNIYWLVSDGFDINKKESSCSIEFFHLKNKLRFIKWRSYKILLTSQYVFTSHAFKIPMHKGMPSQKYITLWHGCGYKNNEGAKLEFNRFFDLALVPTKVFIWSNCFRFLKQDLYLPACFIECCYSAGSQIKVVGQQFHCLMSFVIIRNNSA